MGIENKVIVVADEISARKFRYTYTADDYHWLADKCGALVALLKEANADPSLINKLTSISAELECIQLEGMHELIRQQTLIFNQDAILFYLMKEGYVKLLRF